MNISRILKNAVKVNPSGLATIDVRSGRKQTWQDFSKRIPKLAGALESLGLQAGGRVAVLARNSDGHLEYYFAIIWAGGIFVPLNYRLKSHEICSLLEDCGARILVLDDKAKSVSEEISHLVPGIEHIIFTGEGIGAEDLINHESFMKDADPVPAKKRGGNDTAIIMYTGGTTGQPKGAMLTHKNIISNSRTALDFLNNDEPWCYLHAAPMYHIADCQWNVGVTMMAGTHVFIEKFNPAEVLTVIDDFKITHTALVPTMIKMLCDVPNINSYDLSSLRKVNFGGSPISLELIQRARQTFPGCEFIQGYGLTETSPNISMLPDQFNTEGNPKLESAGRPVSGMSVKIVDKNSDELPRGTIGEIITKGPHVMAGYWKDPAETNKTIRNGWIHTGDLGYMDEDGFIYVVDRLKDMIITGGENVYSTEVEEIIQQLEPVDSCAVIGIPDKTWGEAVYAIVVLKNQEISEQEIIKHCREFLADYKCPKRVEIRKKPLPMSGPGKILKRKLRKPFWPDDARQVS